MIDVRVIDNFKYLEDEIIARMPDTVKVKNHLLRYGSLTSQEAFRRYNITRLAAVVYKLRNRDDTIEIKTDMVYERNQYGEPVQYARYYI